MGIQLKTGTWSPNAQTLFKERYQYQDETMDGMCWRVATDIAQAEPDRSASGVYGGRSYYRDLFYNMMVERKFVPNTPTLANAGTGNGLQYSACYVLPVLDDMGSIFGAIRNAALIHKAAGGTGFSFSRLRHAGARVASTHGQASGPVSFAKVFDAATNAVKQGGIRRGANMGVLSDDHPDIREFINSKRDRVLTNFNISVGVHDGFLAAVRTNTQWPLKAPHTGEIVGYVPARDLWEEIKESAWATGDPGLLFLDRANRGKPNPVPALGPILASNPCGEQFLYDNDVCNLGSVNLSAFVENGTFHWNEFARVVRLAVRFLDDVVTVNPYPLPEITKVAHDLRRIGVGVMGWHHCLMKLNIPYASPEAYKFEELLGRVFQENADAASILLAVERGPFPLFEQSIYAKGAPIRNACRTTVAPTGSISILANCSSGIEPVFALGYEHRANGRVLRVDDPVYAEFKSRPGNKPDLFRTAMEIDYRDHIAHQAVWQKHVDNAVSKTINLQNRATKDDVGNAYMLAYDSGCLGITVFRDGCLGEQVLNATAQPEHPEEAGAVSGATDRGAEAHGSTLDDAPPFAQAAYAPTNKLCVECQA